MLFRSTNVVALPESVRDQLDRICSAATNSTVGYRRLTELCDTFGPRPSGSTNIAAAADWVLATLRNDGLDNVHRETVRVRRWIRGPERVELVAPRTETFPVLGFGGTVATPAGGITAPVLVVTNFAELTARAAEAQGRIVVFNAPFTSYGDSVRYRWSGAVEAAKKGGNNRRLGPVMMRRRRIARTRRAVTARNRLATTTAHLRHVETSQRLRRRRNRRVPRAISRN